VLGAGFLGGAIMLAPQAAYGGDDDAQEVLEHVRNKFDAITDAELRFTQKVRFSLSKVEQTVSGTLLFKKDRKYRIETADQTVVTDGATVWSYSPGTRQVLIDRYKEDEQDLTPRKLLTGAAGGFQAALVGKERLGKSETVQLKLVPVSEQTLIVGVRLWVDEHDWTVRQVEILDANGKQTTYTVQMVKLNAGLPDARFTFQPPGGTDVVDLR
jgi:chaperone LolA